MRMTAWRSDAQNKLEVGEPVVAAKAGFIAEEQQHRREGHRLRDDEKVHTLMR
jgi:hypothetical protein